MKKIRKQQEGFTIIEVLIVLAIAGLIMLIVFLAVPTLQRNSRNTQRNNDASLVAATVNECLNNKNGQVSSCQSIGSNAVSIDTSKLRQLSNTPTYNAASAFSLQEARWSFGLKCTAAGDATTAGSARQFTVTYAVEDSSGTGVNRCIDG
jgi:prepilin-type N-terminal cleavage/methylation domain-containing protein